VREGLTRLWPVLVFALFCLPLFVSLGRSDLQGDEAIYSFGVDRMLEIGDWLLPRSSPSETAVFLEKPPLKFWIVAAPIRLGLLPHDDFGLRFWDAVFGSAAFLYVFGIGRRLAGSVCGAVAVLVLFVHQPLIFQHGLRSNNMEAALFLSFCGGVYHFLAWGSEASAGWRRAHAAATGLYFVLGFMTKFVAALFLPLVLGVVALGSSTYRTRLMRDSRLWSAVALLVAALCAPWFIYAQLRFGSLVWQTMVGSHVYTRFTSYLDPLHLEPWYFYAQTAEKWFSDSGVTWLVLAGMLLLFSQSIRLRWPEGALILVWGTLPLALVSLGSSKLYHYAYPFLPPLALAAGYLVATIGRLAAALLSRALEAAENAVAAALPRATALASRGAVRVVLIVLIWSAAAVGLVAATYEPIRIQVGHSTIFKSGGVLRPAAVIIVLGLLSRLSRRTSGLVVLMLFVAQLPSEAYRATWKRLSTGTHPIRSVVECIQGIQKRGEAPAGIYVDLSGPPPSHEAYYYYRRIQPWVRAESPGAPAIDRYLRHPQEVRPVLIDLHTYWDFRQKREAEGARFSSPPMVGLMDALVLLPGPYAACEAVDDHALHARSTRR
jgi:4-amino-4-deoxy-L-arabinose transferase-like glycosyltransferase